MVSKTMSHESQNKKMYVLIGARQGDHRRPPPALPRRAGEVLRAERRVARQGGRLQGRRRRRPDGDVPEPRGPAAQGQLALERRTLSIVSICCIRTIIGHVCNH